MRSDECVGWSQMLAAEAPGSVSSSLAQPGFRRPGRPVVPADRHASRDQRDSADNIEPALAAEPIEKMEATEATEPIERTDPAEPMHRIEPAEPMDKIDPLDPMLRSEPAEPADRGALAVFPMLRFSHPGRSAAEEYAWSAHQFGSCGLLSALCLRPYSALDGARH
jgi:hypothetical protein